MKINNILKIAGYSIVLILFVFFIGKISQNEYEDEDDKKILEIEQILKNREEKNNVKINISSQNESLETLIIMDTNSQAQEEIKGEAMEHYHYNISQNTPKILTNKNDNNKNYSVNKLNISKQEITPNYESNNNYISENTNEFFWPVLSTEITSKYGKRVHPISNKEKIHNGIDIKAVTGAAVMSSVDGTVTYAGRNGGYGNFIEVRRKDGLTVRYAHLNKINTAVGNNVKMGDKIGEVGSTGVSTGSHLHFEVLKDGNSVNPMDFEYR
nr:M23 family metallopeptidase [uncultured Leptotrichia sp.]